MLKRGDLAFRGLTARQGEDGKNTWRQYTKQREGYISKKNLTSYEKDMLSNSCWCLVCSDASCTNRSPLTRAEEQLH